MTFGIIINGAKFIRLMDNGDLKKKSLEDNVYFTLSDVFCNTRELSTIIKVNEFNDELTGNVCFEDRTDKFEYTNVLYQKDYVKKLQNWLNIFSENNLEFEKVDDKEINIKEYIKLDDWWVQFEELKNLLNIQYEKCCKFEEEDNIKDMDRLREL